MTRWQKERLTEQLKFFGAKKTKFISCYAKKPRIVCRVKLDLPNVDASARDNGNYAREQLSLLYGEQLGRGVQNSALGFNQMAVAQQAQQMGLHPNSLIGTGQSNHGLGGACGIGGLIGMGGYGAIMQ